MVQTFSLISSLRLRVGANTYAGTSASAYTSINAGIDRDTNSGADAGTSASASTSSVASIDADTNPGACSTIDTSSDENAEASPD